MGRKALILYVSVTGNTEKIAKCFQEALEEMQWSVDLIKITNKTNFVEEPVFFDAYDLLFVGSPIMAGLPSTLVGKNLGPYGVYAAADVLGSTDYAWTQAARESGLCTLCGGILYLWGDLHRSQ